MQREFAAVVARVEEAAGTHRWDALVVFGAGDVRDMFVSALTERWQKKVIQGPEGRFPTVDVKELGQAVAEAVASWREQSDREDLRTLLDSLGAYLR